MGWFSPVKGKYPGIGQVDKTLPVKDGDFKTVKRGTVFTLSSDPEHADGVWKIAGRKDVNLYVSLQEYEDLAAGHAGTVFYEPKNKVAGVPRITGLCLGQDGEYQTSVYDKSVKYSIGDELTVENGVITKASDGDAVFGVVTRTPVHRWVNNAVAMPPGYINPRIATRTGWGGMVLEFKAINKQVVEDTSSSDPGPEYEPTEDGGAVVEGETNEDGTLTVEGELNPDGTMTVNV